MYTWVSCDLPTDLEGLTDLALDVRWTWSHAGDALWRMVSPETWEQTKNPWIILQNVPRERLEQLAKDSRFTEELQRLTTARQQYLRHPGWHGQTQAGAGIRRVAYLSMEFGLGEALPLYAGGLGVLAGDYLKAASDLGVPVVGAGLLYHEGYFREMLDENGNQRELYPYNDPISLPLQPVLATSGGWLRISLEFPGRTYFSGCGKRVWAASPSICWTAMTR